MTALNLRLQKRLEVETEAATGAVATLRRVADEKGAVVRGGSRLDVTIPANDGGSGKRVAVDPGRWLVEATLPSGEVISTDVAVAEGEEVPVILRASERSPHEWLGWQHLIGNVEGARTLERMTVRSRSVEAPPPSGEAVFRGGLGVAPRDEPAVGLRPGLAALRGAAAWEGILGPSVGPSPACSYRIGRSDEAYYLYQFLELSQPGRDFAEVLWRGERFVVSLPLPWSHVVRHQRVPVEMVVRIHPLENAVQLGVAVLDGEFGTLAGLMTASTLPQAKIVVEQAHDMLFGKVDNPLAAAAGGYVLLATGGSEKESAWHGWIENLNNWFPNLPDGAVLKASLRLRYPTGDKPLEEARAALLEAFDRGIPYFSAGIAWLLDGLSSFAADDPDVENKVKLVQRVALRLDLSQAFTVVRLSDRGKRG